MLENKEFKIKSRPNLIFRSTNLTAIEAMSLNNLTGDLENMKNQIEVYTFILEHCEVKIKDTWLIVKTKSGEYFPGDLENDLTSLTEICLKYLLEVIHPLFQKSATLNQEQPLMKTE